MSECSLKKTLFKQRKRFVFLVAGPPYRRRNLNPNGCETTKHHYKVGPKSPVRSRGENNSIYKGREFFLYKLPRKPRFCQWSKFFFNQPRCNGFGRHKGILWHRYPWHGRRDPGRVAKLLLRRFSFWKKNGKSEEATKNSANAFWNKVCFRCYISWVSFGWFSKPTKLGNSQPQADTWSATLLFLEWISFVNNSSGIYSALMVYLTMTGILNPYGIGLMSVSANMARNHGSWSTATSTCKHSWSTSLFQLLPSPKMATENLHFRTLHCSGQIFRGTLTPHS